MWSLSPLILALAAVLRGVPSLASASTDAAVPGPFLDGTIVTIAAGALTVALGAIVLLVARRRGPGSEMATAAAERRLEATEEKVTAALTRRTLHRGRLRFDDELITGSQDTPSEDSTPRAIRRSG